MRFYFKIIFAITALFALAAPLFARDVTVIIKDADIDLPLEGAVIRTRDGREFICDANGTAVVEVPDNRQTVLQAAYPGYETAVIAITLTGNLFTAALRLSGIMESRELVIEASRPGTSESRTGRSVAVGQREISQTGEIGLIEDVMSTIKLLPGVNYSGVFSAQPSVRGGHPGDMSASLDGFYINNPYFWGGGFSIFDPRMVQSAQLSHGVFSTRYGHTISGLLEITTKDPSPEETQLELSINTSASNFSLSLPLAGRGGLLFMGRITYYEPVIETAKRLSGLIPELEVINFIRIPPFIRAGTVTGNYRFTENLTLSATGFWGMDGVGVYYLNSSRTDSLDSSSSADFDFTNFQGFFTSALLWNPRTDMLLKFTLGTGYEDQIIDGEMEYNIHNKAFSNYFKTTYPEIAGNNTYDFRQDSLINQSEFLFNVQGRIDYDWKLTDRLLLSAGVQEMYNHYRMSGKQQMMYDIKPTEEQLDSLKLFFPSFSPTVWNDLRVGILASYSPDLRNNLFTSSGYILGEFASAGNRFKAELGLRIDHFYLTGDSFNLSSDLALNPRLNIDFNVLKNAGFLQSFDISAGTGLFSSVSDIVFSAEKQHGINYIKPNRSWTSILGVRLEFPQSLSLNIEGYYKYVFDRMYVNVGLGLDDIDENPFFDGEGMVWGIDLMIQKIQSRFWDGWLSYSFNWAKYRDPNGRLGALGLDGGNMGGDWYFPSYHRFHNLNMVLNIRPAQNLNLYIRFGIASGVPLVRRHGDSPQSYPVLIYDRDNPTGSYFIEKYYWPSVTDENNRTTVSFPLDIKFSIYGGSRNGKTRYEVYIAVENVLALLYTASGNTSFNRYTGEVDSGSTSANYEMPIPIPSFGCKISY